MGPESCLKRFEQLGKVHITSSMFLGGALLSNMCTLEENM